MVKLKIENPILLAQQVQEYLSQKIAEETMHPPFTCEVVVVLGGNIVKSADWYITTPYEKGTKKSFGAQGRVITAALLYHLGVSDCLLLSTGKTDPQDKEAPSEASVMQAELLAYGEPETCMDLEEHSKTTEENARELAKLFTTEQFQEKRSSGLFKISRHIRRTKPFLAREGFKGHGTKIKYISIATMI